MDNTTALFLFEYSAGILYNMSMRYDPIKTGTKVAIPLGIILIAEGLRVAAGALGADQGDNERYYSAAVAIYAIGAGIVNWIKNRRK